MSSSSWISSGNPFTPDTMSSTNPFTSDTSEEELEAPRPGPVSKLFGLSRLSNNLVCPGCPTTTTTKFCCQKSAFVCRHEREAREGRGRKGSEEKLMPLVTILQVEDFKLQVGAGKARGKSNSRGKICFNTNTVKLPVEPVASPYNPFSSSEEDEGEACCEDRRGRVRGRSVAGQN